MATESSGGTGLSGAGRHSGGGASDHFDLCIIGSGSGNTIVNHEFNDWSVAIVDQGVGEGEWFGGTCLNVGCIPTKMMVVPADFAASPDRAARLGVELSRGAVDFAGIQQRVFGRTNAISTDGLAYRESNENVTVFREAAAFIDAKHLQVGDRVITADQFVLAAGSRPRTLDVPGLNDPDLAGLIHTNDTLLRIKTLPKHLMIVGGGVEALEFGHIFSAFGSKVTLVHHGARLLRKLDRDLGEAATKLAAERFSVRLNQSLSNVEASETGGLIVSTSDSDGIDYDYAVDALMVAVGREPNGDLLEVGRAGVTLDDQGFVVVDDQQRTSQPGIWALGDVTSHHLLKHVANAEARTVQYNLVHPDNMIATRRDAVPQAIFSDPPMYSVGPTTDELDAAGTHYVSIIQPYSTVAYGWAMVDDDSFVKLVGDPATGKLLAAHVVGPEAPELGQLCTTAISFGIGAIEMARGQYWAHPELAEVVENALISLDRAMRHDGDDDSEHRRRTGEG